MVISMSVILSLGGIVKRFGQSRKPVLGMLSWQLSDLSEIMKVIFTSKNLPFN